MLRFVVMLRLLVMLSLPVGLSATSLAAEQGSLVTLGGIFHTLDGQALVIHGWVENRGPRPISRLVVDATGFTPAGQPAFFGSDGIPWEIAPGASEPFAVRLLLQERLVRRYVVQVTLIHAPDRPLATVRRSVDISLYRSLLLSVVRLQGDLRGDVFEVRSDVRGWPISGVIVEATLLVPGLMVRPHPDQATHVVAPRLSTLVLDVPANRTMVVRLGFVGAALVSLRVVDVRLASRDPHYATRLRVLPRVRQPDVEWTRFQVGRMRFST